MIVNWMRQDETIRVMIANWVRQWEMVKAMITNCVRHRGDSHIDDS